MDQDISRRALLSSLSTTGALALVGSAPASAEPPSVRLVEAGIRYDVPDRDDYARTHSDSRPPYTVDRDAGALRVLPWAPQSVVSLVSDGVVAEQSAAGNQSVTLGGADRRVGGLPVELTSRMRVLETIGLVEEVTLPAVTLHWNDRGAAVTVASEGRTDVEAGSQETIELATEPVEAQTVSKEFDREPVDDVPEDMLAPKTTYDAVAIEVTPVVEVVDHGTLTVERVPSPQEQ